MSPPRLTVCKREEDVPSASTPPGTRTGACSRCCARVWVTPSTDARLAQRAAALLCEPCARSIPGLPGWLETPSLAQLDELEQATGMRLTAREALALLRKYLEAKQ